MYLKEVGSIIFMVLFVFSVHIIFFEDKVAPEKRPVIALSFDSISDTKTWLQRNEFLMKTVKSGLTVFPSDARSIKEKEASFIRKKIKEKVDVIIIVSCNDFSRLVEEAEIQGIAVMRYSHKCSDVKSNIWNSVKNVNLKQVKKSIEENKLVFYKSPKEWEPRIAHKELMSYLDQRWYSA